MIKYLWYTLVSYLKEGRTLGQKKRYIRDHHPTLYKYLYEEVPEL